MFSRYFPSSGGLEDGPVHQTSGSSRDRKSSMASSIDPSMSSVRNCARKIPFSSSWGRPVQTRMRCGSWSTRAPGIRSNVAYRPNKFHSMARATAPGDRSFRTATMPHLGPRDGNDDVVQIVRLECGQFVVENRKSLPPPEDPPVTGWPNIRKIGREELLPELDEVPHPRILAQDFEVCDPGVDLRPNNYGEFARLLLLHYTHPSSVYCIATI